MTTTNSNTNLTRAEKRRAWKEFMKKEQYEKSGFFDLNWGPLPQKIRISKYIPHIGKKQIGRGH